MNSKLIINTAVGLILFSLIWLVLMPAYSGLSDLRNEVDLKKKAIDLESEVIKKLNSINELLDAQKTNVERLEQAIPDAELKPELISIMENLASQNGLSLSAVGVEAVAEETGARTNRGRETVASKSVIKKMKLEINASGKYSAFKSWLMAVEKSLRIIDVNKITFAIAVKKTAEGTEVSTIDPAIDFNVSMSTYVLKKN